MRQQIFFYLHLTTTAATTTTTESLLVVLELKEEREVRAKIIYKHKYLLKIYLSLRSYLFGSFIYELISKDASLDYTLQY